MKTDGGTSTFAGIYQYDRLNRLRYSKRAEWGGSAFLAPTDKLASEYRYDPNGNIQALRRAVGREQSGVFANFDEFRYDYTGGTNKLSLLHDSSAVRFAPDGTASSASNPKNTDITGTRAYLYDEAGNVRSDAGRTITWTPYGKVETVQKETGAGEVRFIYDAQGNRVLKEETGAGGAVSKRTWYVRDAVGQHLTTYEQSGGSGTSRAKEYLLYGSTRLGTAYADNANGGAPVSGALYRRVVGQKQYELGDHLGNVRATVGDIKVRNGSTFAARVESHTEYFPFGMVASTATVAGGVGGRFGFNGMEKDNEVKGEGNHVDFGARWYDSRVGRWGSVDPEFSKLPNYSPYGYVSNSPIFRIDPDGRWDIDVHVYHDRSKYGFGILIVKDRHGKEVYRMQVRAEGLKGRRDRLKEGADTPLGKYDIPNGGTKWMRGGDRGAYGPNARLVLNGIEGEIIDSKRTEIRVHGGRQEKEINGKWYRKKNANLWNTAGCLRAWDEDMAKMKEITDGLEAADKQEVGGRLEVKADLVRTDNGEYVIPSEAQPSQPGATSPGQQPSPGNASPPPTQSGTGGSSSNDPSPAGSSNPPIKILITPASKDNTSTSSPKPFPPSRQ